MDTEDRIYYLQKQINLNLRNAVENAIEMGGILIKMKSNKRHGEWKSYVKKFMPFSPRMASSYMRMFEDRDKLSSARSISESIGLLSTPKEKCISLLPKKKVQVETVETVETNKWSDLEEKYDVLEARDVVILAKKSLHYDVPKALARLIMNDDSIIGRIKRAMRELTFQDKDYAEYMDLLDPEEVVSEKELREHGSVHFQGGAT
jgi:hypothetical protein